MSQTFSMGTSNTNFGPFLANLAMKGVDPGAQFAVGAYNEHNAKRAAQRYLEAQKELMALQYEYNKRAYEYSQTQGPTLYRQGLTSAGYNPILPFAGSGSGMSGSMHGVSGASAALENPAFLDPNAINNARMISANLINLKSQTNVNNANASLLSEKENSERVEQALKFNQSELFRIESELKQKDLDKYDERWLLEKKERLTKIDTMLRDSYSNQAIAGASVSNAKSNMITATEGSGFKLLQSYLRAFGITPENVSSFMSSDKGKKLIKTLQRL